MARGEIIYDYGDFAEEIAFLTKGSVRFFHREGTVIDLIPSRSTLTTHLTVRKEVCDSRRYNS